MVDIGIQGNSDEKRGEPVSIQTQMNVDFEDASTDVKNLTGTHEKGLGARVETNERGLGARVETTE
jgi:hypothetical protein